MSKQHAALRPAAFVWAAEHGKLTVDNVQLYINTYDTVSPDRPSIAHCDEMKHQDPLLSVTYHEQLDVMQLLLDNGAILDRVDWFHRTPLHRAVAQGFVAGVEIILEAMQQRYRGNDPYKYARLINHQEDPDEDRTPLMFAARQCTPASITIVNLLLEAKAAVNADCETGQALLEALHVQRDTKVAEGQEDDENTSFDFDALQVQLVHTLLEHKADIELPRGQPVFLSNMLPLWHRDRDQFKRLFKLVLTSKGITADHQGTLLHQQIVTTWTEEGHEDFELLQFLLEVGKADVNAVSRVLQYTVLHKALTCGKTGLLPLVQYLVAQKADLHQQYMPPHDQASAYSPLFLACNVGWVMPGMRPLNHAFVLEHLAMAKLFCDQVKQEEQEQQDDIDSKDNNSMLFHRYINEQCMSTGNSIYLEHICTNYYAWRDVDGWPVSEPCPEVQFLINQAADINLPDKYGTTATMLLSAQSRLLLPLLRADAADPALLSFHGSLRPLSPLCTHCVNHFMATSQLTYPTECYQPVVRTKKTRSTCSR